MLLSSNGLSLALLYLNLPVACLPYLRACLAYSGHVKPRRRKAGTAGQCDWLSLCISILIACAGTLFKRIRGMACRQDVGWWVDSGDGDS